MECPIKKRYIAIFAVLAIALGSFASAQNRPISGGLPWDNAEADPILQQRVEAMFPDGTPLVVLIEALQSERFSMGFFVNVPQPYHGTGSSTKNVVRLVLGCGSTVNLQWQQVGGVVYDMTGRMHQRCL